MLSFPNCKINLGLAVTEKRADGFHNIETVFYPINWCDNLEIINNSENKAFDLTTSGISIDGPLENNLIYKAWKLVSQIKQLPNIKVHLHKNVPMGAGLGGGSSDAAFFINLLDSKFNLNLPIQQRVELASELGSDCAFFIRNKPVFAVGKGNEFSEINISLDQYYILVVHPNVHSNTKEAYEGLTPKKTPVSIRSIVESTPLKEWKDTLVNDFETSIFKKYPAIKELKEQMYNSGALYACISGSGSSVFGIFDSEPKLQLPDNYLYCLQNPKSKIL